MSALLIPEPPLQVLPTLATEVGLNEAIFLQQLHYWSLRARDDEGWVYKTLDEWAEELPWMKGKTDRTIRRVVKNLEEQGMLETKQPEGTKRRKHYRIAYDRLPEAVKLAASSGQNGRLSNKTERTTEKENKKKKRTVNKKAVSDSEFSLAAAVVQLFNSSAGTALSVEAHLTPIVGRIREHPDYGERQHRAIIEAVFAGEHWWSGPPTPKIIYGNPSIFEQSIELARARMKDRAKSESDPNAERERVRREFREAEEEDAAG